MKKIEIIVPCYNEQECVSLLYERVNEVAKTMPGYKTSLLFVDDGSSDKTMVEIKKLVELSGNDTVKYISFSRNFGKESAIYAGLKNSTGDIVILMDADLQHPPEIIPKMLEKIEEGFDCCGARRVTRSGEPLIRSALSRVFYKSMKKLTGMELVQGGSDFRMMTRNVVKAIISLNERERFTKGIFSWVGFETFWLEYENVKRAAGNTKWSFVGLLKYAISGFMAFATTPLRAAIYLGFFIDICSLFYGIYFLIAVLNDHSARTGYATMVLLLMFFSGTIILLLGVIGEYLARIYIEIKHRPIYLEKESNIEEKSKDE